MKNLAPCFYSLFLLLICIYLCSCAAASKDTPATGSIVTADVSEAAHLRTGLTTADYLRFAEDVTDKMLKSNLVQSWTVQKPRLIVGDLVNNTDNEYIRVQDIYERIQEIILNSGLVRIMSDKATAFDYIVKTELTSTRQYGQEGEELAYYTIQLKMFTINGELKGQWSEDLALARGKRRLF